MRIPTGHHLGKINHSQAVKVKDDSGESANLNQNTDAVGQLSKFGQFVVVTRAVQGFKISGLISPLIG